MISKEFEMKKKMYRRSFETKDANGCYFRCEAYYNGPETTYSAMGITTSTLVELKARIANL